LTTDHLNNLSSDQVKGLRAAQVKQLWVFTTLAD